MCALPGSKSTSCLCTSSGCERQTSHREKQSRINQPIHSLHSSFNVFCMCSDCIMAQIMLKDSSIFTFNYWLLQCSAFSERTWKLTKIQISKHQNDGERMLKAQVLRLFWKNTSVVVLVQSLVRLQKSGSEWVLNQILNSFMNTPWFQNLSLYLRRLRNFPRVNFSISDQSACPGCRMSCWQRKQLLTCRKHSWETSSCI